MGEIPVNLGGAAGLYNVIISLEMPRHETYKLSILELKILKQTTLDHTLSYLLFVHLVLSNSSPTPNKQQNSCRFSKIRKTN